MKGSKTIDVGHVVGVVSQCLSNPGSAHGNALQWAYLEYTSSCVQILTKENLWFWASKKIRESNKGPDRERVRKGEEHLKPCRT